MGYKGPINYGLAASGLQDLKPNHKSINQHQSHFIWIHNESLYLNGSSLTCLMLVLMKQNCSVTLKILDLKFEFSFVLLSTIGTDKFPPAPYPCT